MFAFTACGLFRRNGAHDVRPGVLRVHATARSIHIQLRVAVLHSPPRPESLRSASAAKQAAHVTLVAFGGTTFVFLRARRPATARSRASSRALHPPSAARYGVGGIPPSLSRLHLSAQSANRPRGSRSCSPPHPRSRLHLGSGGVFLRSFLRVVGFGRLRLAAVKHCENPLRKFLSRFIIRLSKIMTPKGLGIPRAKRVREADALAGVRVPTRLPLAAAPDAGDHMPPRL